MDCYDLLLVATDGDVNNTFYPHYTKKLPAVSTSRLSVSSVESNLNVWLAYMFLFQ